MTFSVYDYRVHEYYSVHFVFAFAISIRNTTNDQADIRLSHLVYVL